MAPVSLPAWWVYWKQLEDRWSVQGGQVVGDVSCTPAGSTVEGSRSGVVEARLAGIDEPVAHPAVDLLLRERHQGFDPGPGVRGDW